MKDVMFIGPYRQNDGWGGGAKDYVSCLSGTSTNLAIRPIYMSGNIDREIPDKMVRLENTMLERQPDYVIQNVLPHLLEFQHNSKNIGVFYLENSTIKPTGWVSHINLIDEVWVSSSFERRVLQRSGVTIPIQIVSMPYDFSKAEKEYKDVGIADIENSFTFYFIGEYTDRKNIAALVKAFHIEFNHSDNVSLVIKTNASGVSSEALTQKVIADINNIKMNMRLYRDVDLYIPEFVVAAHLTEDELFSLHKNGDCFVMPSRGESLNRPLMDAVAMGNQVIYTGGTGMDEVAPWGRRIAAHDVPVLTSNPPLPNLYTSRETWREVDVLSLASNMRAAYNADNKEKIKNAGLNYNNLKDEFSYGTILDRMNDLLC